MKKYPCHESHVPQPETSPLSQLPRTPSPETSEYGTPPECFPEISTIPQLSTSPETQPESLGVLPVSSLGALLESSQGPLVAFPIALGTPLESTNIPRTATQLSTSPETQPVSPVLPVIPPQSAFSQVIQPESTLLPETPLLSDTSSRLSSEPERAVCPRPPPPSDVLLEAPLQSSTPSASAKACPNIVRLNNEVKLVSLENSVLQPFMMSCPASQCDEALFFGVVLLQML